MDKIPVCYGKGIDPYCPRCGSGEYLHNEDGNRNNFCGQCGCPLDWSQMYNEDTEQVEEKHKCGDCAEYCRSAIKETEGACKAKGVLVRRSGCRNLEESFLLRKRIVGRILKKEQALLLDD